jgi:hypothetical protein
MSIALRTTLASLVFAGSMAAPVLAQQQQQQQHPQQPHLRVNHNPHNVPVQQAAPHVGQQNLNNLNANPVNQGQRFVQPQFVQPQFVQPQFTQPLRQSFVLPGQPVLINQNPLPLQTAVNPFFAGANPYQNFGVQTSFTNPNFGLLAYNPTGLQTFPNNAWLNGGLQNNVWGNAYNTGLNPWANPFNTGLNPGFNNNAFGQFQGGLNGFNNPWLNQGNLGVNNFGAFGNNFNTNQLPGNQTFNLPNVGNGGLGMQPGTYLVNGVNVSLPALAGIP